jgi:hypothetical protein
MSDTPTASGDETAALKHQDGFEVDGDFYRYAISTHNKDMLLIDRFTNRPPQEFFDAVESRSIFEMQRTPMLLALAATSIRAAHPDWSVERIARIVEDRDFDSIVWFGGDEEERTDIDGPPSQEDSAVASSDSSPDESSPSPTPPEPSESET